MKGAIQPPFLRTVVRIGKSGTVGPTSGQLRVLGLAYVGLGVVIMIAFVFLRGNLHRNDAPMAVEAMCLVGFGVMYLVRARRLAGRRAGTT